MGRCGLDASGLGLGPVMGCCEHGNKAVLKNSVVLSIIIVFGNTNMFIWFYRRALFRHPRSELWNSNLQHSIWWWM